MVIILVRHAKALDKLIAQENGQQDSTRALTDQGRVDFAKFIKDKTNYFKNVDRIFSSPYKRALETAEILIAKLLPEQKITSEKRIQPDEEPQNFYSFLLRTGFKKIVLVTHEPFLSEFVQLVTATPVSNIKFKKGCIVIVKLQKSKAAELRQLLNP